MGSSDMSGVRVERREEAADACRSILAELPEWFGMPEANEAYARTADEHPSWVAVDDGTDVGIITIVQHAARAAEVHLLAVRPGRHRHGIGTQLLERAEAHLRGRGVRFLQVKTLAPAKADEGYARTRAFYEARGFVTLEDFPDLWDPHNPARQMIKTVSSSGLVDVPDPGLPDWKALAAAERRDLADLLDTLTPEQWCQPSLCDGWTVRDVVAHLISYEELGTLGLVGAVLRTGFRPSRLNASRLDAYRDHRPEQLVQTLRSHLTPRGLTAGFGGRIGLTDCVIHHQDIRRSLALPRDVPPERLLEALDFSFRAPVLPSRRNAADLRLVATDLDWRRGDGPRIEGPGEALLMALAGRPGPLGELEGDGVPTLAARIGA